MATKHEVLDLHKKHPTMTAPEMALRLNCSSEYIRATFRRNGIKTPRVFSKSPEQLIARAQYLERLAKKYREDAKEMEGLGLAG